MSKVKISSKYQIVIPKRVRESLKLKPGQEVQVLNINGRLTLIPVRPIESYRGMLKGSKIDFSEIREKKDREI
jgi:AbrB family looped-hinge helix DNA binding protein